MGNLVNADAQTRTLSVAQAEARAIVASVVFLPSSRKQEEYAGPALHRLRDGEAVPILAGCNLASRRARQCPQLVCSAIAAVQLHTRAIGAQVIRDVETLAAVRGCAEGTLVSKVEIVQDTTKIHEQLDDNTTPTSTTTNSLACTAF